MWDDRMTSQEILDTLHTLIQEARCAVSPWLDTLLAYHKFLTDLWPHAMESVAISGVVGTLAPHIFQ